MTSLATFVSGTKGDKKTFTIQNVKNYRFIFIACKFGDNLVDSHFFPSGYLSNTPAFYLYIGPTAASIVTFNSDTSVTITQNDATYTPATVWGIN